MGSQPRVRGRFNAAGDFGKVMGMNGTLTTVLIVLAIIALIIFIVRRR